MLLTAVLFLSSQFSDLTGILLYVWILLNVWHRIKCLALLCNAALIDRSLDKGGLSVCCYRWLLGDFDCLDSDTGEVKRAFNPRIHRLIGSGRI